jgi:hypothetical protein
MATDKKITSLNALTAGDLDLELDSLVIVNENESKKITPGNLLDSCVKSTSVDNIVEITESEYNQLSSVDSRTLYIITI